MQNSKKKITRIREKRSRDEERSEEERREERHEEITIVSQFTASMITRSDANVSRFMLLIDNIESNDDDFNVSKQNDENAKKNEMH